MNHVYPFSLEPLRYECDALEPYIGTQTIRVHFSLFLNGYVEKLNNILEQYPELQEWTLEQMLLNYQLLPLAVQEPIKNNAGGIYNHYLYFDCMTPCSTAHMNNEFSIILRKEFGSIKRFQELFLTAVEKSFGSAYVWLVVNANGNLAIVTTKNQDNPLSFGLYPILTLDLWEHAFYLNYLNKKKDYATNWFCLIDWDYVYQRYCSIYQSLAKCRKLSQLIEKKADHRYHNL